jgi:hypothetical protein
MREMFLISEYCEGPFFMGWHLYLRDNKGRQQPNAGGGWGWLRRSDCATTQAHEFLRRIGITLKGDNSCDDGGYAELARRFPIPRQRIGRKPRGCIAVVVDEWGCIAAAPDSTLDSKTPETDGTGLHPTPSDGSASGGNGDNTAPTEPLFFVGIESRETSTVDANAASVHELAEKTGAAGGGPDSKPERFFGKPALPRPARSPSPSPRGDSPTPAAPAGGGGE